MVLTKMDDKEKTTESNTLYKWTGDNTDHRGE
jgi:hypothetical protein